MNRQGGTILLVVVLLSVLSPSHQTYSGAIAYQLTPYGVQPPIANKPSAVYMPAINKIIVAFGYVDNCTSQTATYVPTTSVYAYDPEDNVGYSLETEGDFPPVAAFVSCTLSGRTKMTCFSGVEYSFFFDVIDIKNLTTMYELDVDWGERRAYWTAFNPSGDVPPPRVEVTIVDDPLDSQRLIVYGGVFFNTESFIFQSVGQIYSYHKRRHRWTLLHDQGVYDNGTDTNVPQSRYHAHGFSAILRGDPLIQISQGVHRHSTLEDSTDILDYWQFNLDDKTWEEYFPDPEIGLTGNLEDPERRHDVSAQFEKHSKTYHCLWTGDKAHDSPVHTLGCIFDIDTLSNGQCSNPKDNNKQGSWQLVNYEGILQRAKYPASVTVGMKTFYFGGVHEEPYNSSYNVQVFNTKIGVIDHRNLKKDNPNSNNLQAKSIAEPLRIKPTSIPGSNSPFIDMELVRRKVVEMGKPDPKLAFMNNQNSD